MVIAIVVEPVSETLLHIPTIGAIKEAASFVFISWFLTEVNFWGLGFFFEYFAEHPWLKPYKIRNIEALPDGTKLKVKKEMARLKQHAWDQRWEKYKSDWIIFLGSYALSSMRFSAEMPTLFWCFAEALFLILMFDAWIFIVHYYLHHAIGYRHHKEHHSFRYITCWFVDLESPRESMLIGGGKYAILSIWSPHPYVAFIYLFCVKFWNVLSHCGYNLPLFQFIDTYLPFIASPNLHEIHHFKHDTRYANMCVFTTIFDYMAGTLNRGMYTTKKEH